MIIAIDFDGTCVTHEFPNVGAEIGAAEVLKKLVAKGHQLILWTMRSHKLEGVLEDENFGYGKCKQTILPSDGLDDAVQWFIKHKIPLFGINENPTQSSWTSSPKPYAHLYIDDAGFGIPLKHGFHERPYVDWEKVENQLKFNGIL